MKLINKLQQYRRDFTGEFECESCGHKEIDNSCYDDSYFHQNVIPNKKCGKCGESTISLNLPTQPWATKYPDGFVV